MNKKPLLLLIGVTIVGAGGYYWLKQSSVAPEIIDTTLDKYDETLAVSEKCTKAEVVDKNVCSKVIQLLDKQIQKIQQSSKASKYEKELIRLHKRKSSVYRKTEDIYAAISSLKEATKFDTQNSRNLSRLAALYSQVNAHKEAITYARLTTQIEPFQWQAHMTLAEAYVAAGELEKAHESYAKAIELAPSSRIPTLEKAQSDLNVKKQLISLPIQE